MLGLFRWNSVILHAGDIANSFCGGNDKASALEYLGPWPEPFKPMAMALALQAPFHGRGFARATMPTRPLYLTRLPLTALLPLCTPLLIGCYCIKRTVDQWGFTELAFPT